MKSTDIISEVLAVLGDPVSSDRSTHHARESEYMKFKMYVLMSILHRGD